MTETDLAVPRVHIESDTIGYDGVFRLRRLTLRHRRFDGEFTPPLVREVFDRPKAVMILPYDPVAERIVLVEQFRVGAFAAGHNPWMIELAAGMTEPGEALDAVARRELKEETGLEARHMEEFANFLPSPGALSEKVTAFAACVDISGLAEFGGNPGEHEDLRLHTWSVEEAERRLDNGSIDTAITLIGVAWLLRHRERLNRAWRT
ncbi:MAG: NUDIX domain-containing protein [Rhodospirillaceae bacterium]|nr:NUDIX domain-containing protein [Rhodospirillaceae bacterium]